VVGWGTKGQDLYNSKSVRDKQIVRIIGKVRESLLSLFFPPQGDLLLSVYIARLLRIPHLLPFKCFRLFILSTVLDVFKLCNFWDSVSGANISSCSIFADGWKAASVAFQPAFLLREFPLHAGLSVSPSTICFTFVCSGVRLDYIFIEVTMQMDSTCLAALILLKISLLEQACRTS
jgi:hypothetical protein